MSAIHRKRRAPVEDEDEIAASQIRTQRRRASDDVDFDVVQDAATQGAQVNGQMVKKLVRLALACEYTRTPLRRPEINAKVLGDQTRLFRAVFAEAQNQLRDVFGMQLTELPLKEKVTIQQKRAAARSQNVQKSSGVWILTSALPSRFRAPEILPPPQVPTSETESQYIGLYTFVVSVITLSGGTLPDSKLDRYLKRANVDATAPFVNTMAMSGLDRTEKLLKRMEKDGYVVKVRDSASGEEQVDWMVGPRGKIEVGDLGVRGLAKAVYGDEAEDEDFHRKLERSIGVSERRTQAEQQRPGERKARGRKSKHAEAEAEEEEEEEEGESESEDEDD